MTGDRTGIVTWTLGSQVFASELEPGATTFTAADQLADDNQLLGGQGSQPTATSLAVGTGTNAAIAWDNGSNNAGLSRLTP